MNTFYTKVNNIFLRLYVLILRVICKLLIPKNIDSYELRFLRSNIIQTANKIQSILYTHVNYKLPVLYKPEDKKFYVNCSGIFLDSCYTGRYFKISNSSKTINEAEIFLPILNKTNKSFFVDIGSNFGEISIFLAKKFTKSKVLSIEGSQKNFEILKNNIEINLIQNIIAENSIITNTNGSKFITNNLGSENYITNKSQNESIEVKSFTLDKILEKHYFKKIDFLKIDIEGSVPDLTDSVINLIENDYLLTCMIAFEKNTYESYSKIINAFKNSFESFIVNYHNNELKFINFEDLNFLLKDTLPSKYQGNSQGYDIFFINKKIA
tara:strand:- start:2030 stop:3001 length:972 start_codon:yes stop_codon:yes gene_type:complete